MTIIPAIDLLNGRCVRLYKGDYDRATNYSQDPVSTARTFLKAGITRLHLVDLDAARGEGRNNRDVIRRIREEVPVTIEVGGGIRSERDVEELLEAGIHRLILGTILVRDPSRTEDWIRKYGSCFVAGIDALNGQVKVSGWEEEGPCSDVELARKAAQMGFRSIIYTNIAKDGTLEGPDIERTALIARESGLPVILSGGISSIEDFDAVARCNEELVRGIITGKALYEGRIDLAKTVSLYQREREPDLD